MTEGRARSAIRRAVEVGLEIDVDVSSFQATDGGWHVVFQNPSESCPSFNDVLARLERVAALRRIESMLEVPQEAGRGR